MYKVVLIRHGESEWNKKNLFSGWMDVPLTKKGEEEIEKAAEALSEGEYTFDHAYTSVLARSIKSLWIILEKMNLMWIPVKKSWKLNERHYGALTGLDKMETTKKEGEKQVFLWRRSYKTCPPPMEEDDERNPKKDPKYRDVEQSLLPLGECLEDTEKRVMEYWNDEIEPKIRAGQNILISGHGSMIRVLIKYFEKLSDEKVLECNVPYGIPLVFEFSQDMNFVEKHYLGDPDYVAERIAEIAGQHKEN